jgi:ADP-ribosylglycohydrolase
VITYWIARCLSPMLTVAKFQETLLYTLQRQFIKLEVIQRREEGCDVSAIEARVETALADDDTDNAAFDALFAELEALEPESSFPFEEPSGLAAIQALRPDGPRRVPMPLSESELRDRILGAWLGRAAGCSLGKPVEGWPRERIDRYLEDAGALPLNDYIPFTEGVIGRGLKSSTRGNIEFMARDDDMDYPILGLIALERKGADFSPRTMADVWLGHMPFHLLYTAENVAYRNFVNRCWPPESASYLNPYREWIGAQIRADMFGYVTPGWPETADFAWRDASISHVKNGIYGEMFVAAMLAAAFVTDDIEQIIETGLSEIPARSRLAEAINQTLEWCRTLNDWETVWVRIKERYGHYHGVHTINNAALVVLGLYFGAEDFANGIIVSVRGGWDTDCNGATVGSILGARIGAGKLPEKWVGVLNDRLMSSVFGFNDNRISDLADRTVRVAKDVLNTAAVATPLASKNKDTGHLSGEWRVSLWEPYTLTVNDDLTGQMKSLATGDPMRVQDIAVHGSKLTFTFCINKGGWEMEVRFEGQLEADSFAGICSADGHEFEASGSRIG